MLRSQACSDVEEIRERCKLDFTMSGDCILRGYVGPETEGIVGLVLLFS